MRETTKWLVGETNACIGYTQSDEITLVYYSENYNSQVFFNGNHQKMVSTLSALTTLKFYQELDKFELGYKQVLNPHFDCRVWNVPNKEEAANLILWRENDATRNSIQMAVRSVYSQKEIQNKNCSELQEMLFQKGINWNDYPVFFKRGSYFQRVVVKKKYTIDEIDKLPLKHAARSNKNLVVERSEIVELKLPIFAKIENRVDIIFKGDII
jgi:tRNA(His) 5'-end guanylyltransferase